MGEPIATVGKLAGVCGHDGDDWEKILIDASKRLVVAIASIVAADAQMHGHVGGAWQKQPLIWGYSDVVEERVLDANCSAGTDSVQTTVVPAGEVHVITSLAMYVASGTCGNLVAYKNDGVASYELVGQTSPTSSQIYDRQGFYVLGPSDSIVVYGFNLTAGDDLCVIVTGYKMDIDL